MLSSDRIQEIERIIARDPGSRGIAPLVQWGSLERAVRSLQDGSDDAHLAIFTGFCIPPTETDGPPGALYAARSFLECHPRAAVSVFCDESTYDVIFSCFQPLHDRCTFHVFHTGSIPSAFLENLPNLHVTHALAIERVGPCFADGSYRTMLARDVSMHHAFLHEIWDVLGSGVVRIGVGDGGNEVGMGNVVDLVKQHIPRGELIACASSCDHVIVTGVSNWAGVAMAAILSPNAFEDICGAAAEKVAVQRCLDAGAIDGVLKRAALSVDGFALDNEHGDVRDAIVRQIHS